MGTEHLIETAGEMVAKLAHTAERCEHLARLYRERALEKSDAAAAFRAIEFEQIAEEARERLRHARALSDVYAPLRRAAAVLGLEMTDLCRRITTAMATGENEAVGREVAAVLREAFERGLAENDCERAAKLMIEHFRRLGVYQPSDVDNERG